MKKRFIVVLSNNGTFVLSATGNMPDLRDLVMGNPTDQVDAYIRENLADQLQPIEDPNVPGVTLIQDTTYLSKPWKSLQYEIIA